MAGAPHSLFYDAAKPLNRCLARQRAPLSYLSFIGIKLYYRTGIRAIRLAGHHLDALAVDGHGQHLCTRLDDGFVHALAGLRLD